MPAFARKLFLHILPRLLCIGSAPQKRDHRTTANGTTFRRCTTSTYPSANKFQSVRQRQSSQEDNVRFRTTFVGVETMNVDLLKFCNACNNRSQKQIPVTAKLAMEGAEFIAKHMLDDRDALMVIKAQP